MDPELLEAEEEKHEVDPFDAAIIARKSGLRNPLSRLLHACMILPLLLVLALSITSLSYFAVTNNRIGDLKLHAGSGDCVLYATWKTREQYIKLSSGHACVFAIFGEVAVAVMAAVLILWMVVKTAAGFYMATWVVFCEIPVLVLHMTFAFCVSVTISIGLALTCSSYKQFSNADREGCSKYILPRPNEPNVTQGNTEAFYTNIHTSMVTSWLVVVVLFLMLGLYILLSIVFCCKRIRKSNFDMVPLSDGESSSDGESGDETMVPIAELERH